MIKKYSPFAVVLFVFVVSAMLFSIYQVVSASSNADLSKQGFFRFDNARQLKPVTLTNLSGEAVDLAKGNGQWQMINFGYMFCPDICPVNLVFMGEVKTLWDANNEQSPLSITHITIDPKRDTPEKLIPYLNFMDENLLGLTGEIEEIRKIATQLNTVYILEEPDEYGNYFVTHSDSIALLDPQGNYVGLFKGPYNTDKAMIALEKIIN